ncbi:hypothetical protein DFH08DRAFT_1041077 [Mycena albidolilacea]|uniref:Uncharacterized protein n=1 Tax=Mycena albidolilacea TaxID=1033008 RepID=A0AAD6ZB13_9AGAR|nr:hypothetical protein DFH08DRAFT_1041077 [Mycena albidolilacea]
MTSVETGRLMWDHTLATSRVTVYETITKDERSDFAPREIRARQKVAKDLDYEYKIRWRKLLLRVPEATPQQLVFEAGRDDGRLITRVEEVSLRSVWILFCSALVVIVIGERAAEGCGKGSAPSDAEEKERDARRDAFAAEGRVRVYGRGADHLVRVGPYSYARRRWHVSTRRTAHRMRDAEACGRVGSMVVPWRDEGHAESARAGRRRRRRDAWTVHSKPRARGHEGTNPESKSPVECGVPYGVDAGGGRPYDAGRVDGERGGMHMFIMSSCIIPMCNVLAKYDRGGYRCWVPYSLSLSLLSWGVPRENCVGGLAWLLPRPLLSILSWPLPPVYLSDPASFALLSRSSMAILRLLAPPFAPHLPLFLSVILLLPLLPLPLLPILTSNSP